MNRALSYVMFDSRRSRAQASEKPATENPVTIESAVENAKRAFALKKYEQAVEHYSTALEHAYVASFSAF